MFSERDKGSVMWEDAIDSQAAGGSRDLIRWWVERVCLSHLACEQGGGLCRSQQVSGACGGQGGGV